MNKLYILLVPFLISGIAKSQNPQVKTCDGIVEGVYESGIKVFKGIPFATPPIGNLRWKAPQPVQKREGIFQAYQYGPNPMQEPVYGDMSFGTDKMSEDCLYLNIWTPAKSMTEKLPVLIYFNGGGFIAGSGSEPRYAGWSMARKDIISITANYREGIFGFFAHPSLSAETNYKGSGNYGLLDQQAAIKWVKENISAFGGDPHNITVAGESAGAMSVCALMASPLSKGLFSKAIASSGSMLGFKNYPTLKEAEQMGIEKMKEMGCKSLEELRTLSAEELMKKAAVKSVPVYNIDGYFMTDDPLNIYARGEQMKIPLLIGGNSHEITTAFLLKGKSPVLATVRETTQSILGGNVDALLKVYGLETDNDINSEKAVALASDLFIGFATWKWGHMHKLTGNQPVYRYNYRHPRPDMIDQSKVAGLAGGVMEKSDKLPSRPKPKGAAHSADIEYAMGTLPTNRVYDWQPDDYIMSNIFQNYYVNFIKTGNPNGLGLPDWNPTNGQDIAPVLQLDIDTYQKSNAALEQRYELMDKVWNDYRKKNSL